MLPIQSFVSKRASIYRERLCGHSLQHTRTRECPAVGVVIVAFITTFSLIPCPISCKQRYYATYRRTHECSAAHRRNSGSAASVPRIHIFACSPFLIQSFMRKRASMCRARCDGYFVQRTTAREHVCGWHSDIPFEYYVRKDVHSLSLSITRHK